MSSEPRTGGRRRMYALACGLGLLAFVFGASVAGRSATETAPPTTTEVSGVSSTTGSSPDVSTATSQAAESTTTTTSANDESRPTTIVVATATQLIAVDLAGRDAVVLSEIETGLGIPIETFDRVQLGTDGFVYFDRIRAELRGATYRIRLDGSQSDGQRLIEGVSPAVHHKDDGTARLVTLGRRDRAEMVISDLDPDGIVLDQRKISAEANTVPRLRHPSWSPSSLGSAHVIVEWIEAGKVSQLIVVDVDRATSLDEDDRAAAMTLPDRADWTLPVWPGEDIRVISRTVGSRTQLIAADPVNGRDAKAIADGGPILHHSHDASGAHALVVDEDGLVAHLDGASWQSLDLDDVVVEIDGALASLTSVLDGKVVAADW